MATMNPAFSQLHRALDDAEQALEELDERGAFSADIPSAGSPADAEEISLANAEFETALETATDEMTEFLEPHNGGPLTISEILAPYAEAGFIRPEVVETAGKLSELLANAIDGQTVNFGSELDYDFLIGVIDAMRTLTRRLEREYTSPPGL